MVGSAPVTSYADNGSLAKNACSVVIVTTVVAIKMALIVIIDMLVICSCKILLTAHSTHLDVAASARAIYARRAKHKHDSTCHLERENERGIYLGPTVGVADDTCIETMNVILFTQTIVVFHNGKI